MSMAKKHLKLFATFRNKTKFPFLNPEECVGTHIYWWAIGRAPKEDSWYPAWKKAIKVQKSAWDYSNWEEIDYLDIPKRALKGYGSGKFLPAFGDAYYAGCGKYVYKIEMDMKAAARMGQGFIPRICHRRRRFR